MGNFKLYFFIFLIITILRIIFNYNLTTLPSRINYSSLNKNILTNNLFYSITNYYFLDATGKFYLPKYNLTKSDINEAKILLKKLNYNNNFEKILYIILTIIDIIGLIGIYGYAFKKYIFNKLFWLIFITPFFLSQSYLIYNSTYGDKIAFLLSLVIIMPSIYILYLYIFKEKWY